MAVQSEGKIVRKARNNSIKNVPRANTGGRTISRVSKRKQSYQSEESIEKKVNYRISNIEFGAVMSIAIAIDLIEIILAATGVGEVANYALDIGKVVIIPIWLMMKGVSPMKPGRLLRLSIMFLIGFIPFVGSIAPEVALGMWATMRHSRKEDEKGVK